MDRRTTDPFTMSSLKENAMKSLLRVLALLLVWSSCTWMTPQSASAQVSVSFQLFYDELSPYGRWVDYPNYGYVWIPNADPRFSPYATSGHWIYTNYGWAWVSDYPWGWAAFHYGRWDYNDQYGWLWIPGEEWGPAWVSWRRSPGYYGWAPLGPGISVSMAFGGGYQVPTERWVFVRDRDFGRPNINNYYVNRTSNVTILKTSTVIQTSLADDRRHETYIAGPDRNEVQKFSGRSVKPVAVAEYAKPGMKVSNDRFEIYRPRVQRGKSGGGNAAPSKVVKLDELKSASGKNAGHQQPRMETSPKADQPRQGRDVRSPEGRGNEKRSQTVAPRGQKMNAPPKATQGKTDDKKPKGGKKRP
jgi:hypothetical protein